MRVALVCPYSWSRPGGVQTHVAGLAAALRRAGHEADVLAPWDGPGEPPGIVPLGRSLPIPDNGSVQRVALGPAAVARTVARVRNGGYDVVHVHEPMIPWVSLAAVYGARAPLVGTFHMVADGPRWYRVFGLVCRHAAARLAARIAVSPAARDYVQDAIGGDYVVIPNGIEPPEEPHEGGGGIVFVGRPEPRKGLPVLLEAFRRLPGEPRLTLVGVDPGELEEPLPRVRALGRVSDAERRRALAAADVLCVPSLGKESFGLVLVEGMAAGLPVVASSIRAYADLLPEACGRLVPPGDPAALAGALAPLLGDAGLRARMGAAGRAAAAAYHWSALAPRVVDVYERVLAGGPARLLSPEPVR